MSREITILEHLQFHQRRFEGVKESYQSKDLGTASGEYVKWSYSFKEFLKDEFSDEVSKIEFIDHARGPLTIQSPEKFADIMGNEIDLLFADLIERISNDSANSKS